MNFELELSKGKQNSLGETLKVVDFIKKNPKKVEHLFQCLYSENSLVAMRAMNGVKTDSYTHLTQPTILLV